MVRQVYGYCNDLFDVLTFQYNEGRGKWEVSLPSISSGSYIVQIWAEDYAENKGYWGSVVFTWNSETMEVQMRIIDISASARANGFGSTDVYLSDYHAIFKCSKCRKKGVE